MSDEASGAEPDPTPGASTSRACTGTGRAESASMSPASFRARLTMDSMFSRPASPVTWHDAGCPGRAPQLIADRRVSIKRIRFHPTRYAERAGRGDRDRKSVVEGKSVSVRVEPGVRRNIKKKNTH